MSSTAFAVRLYVYAVFSYHEYDAVSYNFSVDRLARLGQQKFATFITICSSSLVKILWARQAACMPAHLRMLSKATALACMLLKPAFLTQRSQVDFWPHA